jgi:hypothetical protein
MSQSFDFCLKIEKRKVLYKISGHRDIQQVTLTEGKQELLLGTKDKMKFYKQLNRLLHSPMLLPWLLDFPCPAGRSSIDTDTSCASSSRSTL